MHRSPSDFSDASNVSVGHSTHTDIFDSPETTPLLGISVQTAQSETRQGKKV